MHHCDAQLARRIRNGCCRMEPSDGNFAGVIPELYSRYGEKKLEHWTPWTNERTKKRKNDWEKIIKENERKRKQNKETTQTGDTPTEPDRTNQDQMGQGSPAPVSKAH